METDAKLIELRNAIEGEDSLVHGKEFAMGDETAIVISNGQGVCGFEHVDCYFRPHSHLCPGRNDEGWSLRCTSGEDLVFIPKLDYLTWKLTQT